MNAMQNPPARLISRPSRLVFSPLAWLKLQYLCHAGDTEVGGFAITAANDPLYVEEFVTVQQRTSSVSVVMDDQAVADFLDRCVDAGLPPARVLRIWIHTHPGSSPEPSYTDEMTFARVFGRCEWAVMFILDRSGNTYARLSFHVGPAGAVQLAVSVDWSAWPTVVNDPVFSMANRFAEWRKEFVANVHPGLESLQLFTPSPLEPSLEVGSPWEPFAETWDWTDLDQQIWEEYEQHERALTGNRRA